MLDWNDPSTHRTWFRRHRRGLKLARRFGCWTCKCVQWCCAKPDWMEHLYWSKDLQTYWPSVCLVTLVIFYWIPNPRQSKSTMFSPSFGYYSFFPTTKKANLSLKKNPFEHFWHRDSKHGSSLWAAARSQNGRPIASKRRRWSTQMDDIGRLGEVVGYLEWGLGGMELTDLTDSEWSWCRIKVFPLR